MVNGSLREIALRLVVETKPHGIVARLGGDEFGILLQRSTEALAGAAAQRLVDAVAQPIRIGTQEVAVGVSTSALRSAPGPRMLRSWMPRP